MKRVFALLLTLILCLGCLPAAFAAEPEYEIIHETTEYLPDGTKVTVTLSVQPVRTRGRVYTVNGKKITPMAPIGRLPSTAPFPSTRA